MNYGVDSGIYPLGSCTMKYNPKINEFLAGLPKLSMLHPYQDESTVQGILEILYWLERWLAEITGTAEVCLQPAAGAHGEFLGTCLMRAYHKLNGNPRSVRTFSFQILPMELIRQAQPWLASMSL
jgi:glycine dehydrogenase subunit 2